jgi:hypothetical protein
MSRMHRLFGVTMIEKGVSRLVSVDLGGAERLLAAEKHHFILFSSRESKLSPLPALGSRQERGA